MLLARDYALSPGQVAWPLVWREPAPRGLSGLDVSDAYVLPQFGGAGRSRLLRMWGKDPPLDTFYLGVRGGLDLHHDPGYTRYSHQVILRNDGWRIDGLEVRPEEPPLVVGTFYCLDTHSPHQLTRDPRLGTGLYWVALVVDTDEPLTADVAWACLESRLEEAHV